MKKSFEIIIFKLNDKAISQSYKGLCKFYQRFVVLNEAKYRGWRHTYVCIFHCRDTGFNKQQGLFFLKAQIKIEKYGSLHCPFVYEPEHCLCVFKLRLGKKIGEEYLPLLFQKKTY